MIDHPIVLLSRAKDIIQTEGVWLLFVRSFHYFKRFIFLYRNYYLYKHSIQERDEVYFLPDIRDFIFKIVSSNKEADQLAVEMGYDFRKFFNDARNRLDRGAVAFCVFVDNEIAFIGWVAMNKEAKNTFDPAPYYVDFASSEACTGGTYTVQKYRGKGLMAYVSYKRFEYLRDKGITISRNAVTVDNVISQKVNSKFSPEIYAQARYIRILWWTYWKEMPFTKVAN